MRIGNVFIGIPLHIEANCVSNFPTYSFIDANIYRIQHMAYAYAAHKDDITTRAGEKNYNGNLDDYNVIEGT